ncbi:MAG: tRNA pseudouridine(38-40) synthase TruA [Chloroflexota bacterium]|nr:tRNA pseudouridine(38-40) synthase TruA [Chloroflexota bacterium]
MRIALTVEYDGTRYSGSQIQKRVPTIQSELENAVAKVTGEPVRAMFAGRTDQGVHAKGQVVAFDTRSSIVMETMIRALNYYLPYDIAVKEAREVSDDFDPRRDALSREYCYYILNETTRSPLHRHYHLLVRRPIEVEAMDKACRVLIGTHDFMSFAGAVEEGKSTIRTVYNAKAQREGAMVTCHIEANAFLPHQMRHTVGALLKVGLKESDISAFCEIFNSNKPATAGPAVPPRGLCLLKVNYSGDVR